jgi:hypothetical protein
VTSTDRQAERARTWGSRHKGIRLTVRSGLGLSFSVPPALRQTAGCPSGQRERSVKPSAQPTLVRTQHLPPPAKTARWLRKRGPAGRFPLVPPCVIVCRHRSSRSNRYGHIADSVRAEGAVRGTACFADPRPFCTVTRVPRAARLTGAFRASRAAGSPPFCSRRTAGWSCSYPWPGRLPHRPRRPAEGCHGGGDRVRRPPPGGRLARLHGERRCPRIWALRERRRHAARVSRCPLARTGSG